MLNKNANCYNIKKIFKYSTVIISTFCEHIRIFRILSIDIWQLKCQWQTNKTKNGELFYANFSELSNSSSSSFWEKPLWHQKLLLLTATPRRSCYTLFQRWGVFLIHTNLFGTNFRHQNKNNVIETISWFVYQLSKIYCIYYVSEHLKYCS